MLTEFEVRRRMESIQASTATPARKARLLLRLGRTLRIQARSLFQIRNLSARAPDRNAAAHLERMERQTSALREDLRGQAFEAFRKAG